MVLLKVYIVLVGLCLMAKPQINFFPNLPLGEYRIIFLAIYPCESTKDQILGWNLYFSKKSQNTTEMKGNLTFKESFDDSSKLDINLSSWSLIGGWKKNSYVYLTDNACSKLKYVMGNVWFSATSSFNISNHCPLPRGTYTTKGLDIKYLQDHNFPKVYYYGKYKGVISIKNKKNKLLGCVALEFNLVRPWEMSKY
ncbi:uncharacterized protein LOC132928916 [Rhopalosiphum padi]|uniref:uncharacterized protein LOC132928916 n=1 Tax=Rhopalosiphum padi TaxID=40932 RepID=UPI00298DDC82|nr:uncharacterized protein LOC132928916 [Rhopalosiphum padi]